MICNSPPYATDEDIALRASSDFALLCPRDQSLASGGDGVFSPTDRWSMMSATVDFASQGLVPGNVLLLTKPAATFKPPGEALVVASVGTGIVTLRRKGLPSGVGQPPGLAAGLNGVEFAAATLGPQICRESFDLDQRYGIDDLVAGRRTCDLYDPREVKDAVVLAVLHARYSEMSRDGAEQHDNFTTKARLVKADLDDLLARVVVHWRPAGAVWGGDISVSRFATRLTR